MKPFIQNITGAFADAVAMGIGGRQIRMRQRWRPNGVYRTPRYAHMLSRYVRVDGEEFTLTPDPKLTSKSNNWNNVPRYRLQHFVRKYHNATAYKRPAHKLKPRFKFEL